MSKVVADRFKKLRLGITCVALVCAAVSCSPSQPLPTATQTNTTNPLLSAFAGAMIPSRPIQAATVSNGLAVVPYAADLQTLFPGARVANLFSGARDGYDHRTVLCWNTMVMFGGRYELTYQIEVVPDFQDRTIKSVVGKPRFVIDEIDKLVDTPGGLGAYYRGSYRFTGADFEKVLAAGGDFSVIGIKLDTNHPLARFDQFVDYGTLADYHIVTNK